MLFLRNILVPEYLSSEDKLKYFHYIQAYRNTNIAWETYKRNNPSVTLVYPNQKYTSWDSFQNPFHGTKRVPDFSFSKFYNHVLARLQKQARLEELEKRKIISPSMSSATASNASSHDERNQTPSYK